MRKDKCSIKKIFNERGGQSLVEILVGISIAAIIIGSATSAISTFLRSNTESKRQQAAILLAQELADNLRAFAEGNWHNIYDLTHGSSTHYYLNTTASPFTTSTGEEAVTVENVSFSRYFYVDNVSRDSSGNIESTYSASNDDPSTQKITIVVTWQSTRNITLEEYLTRSRTLIFRQTDWSGGSGQENFASSSSGGIVNTLFASSSGVNFSVSGQLTLSGLPPSQITDLAATAGDTQVSLSWSAPSDGGSVIQYYRIYRGLSSAAKSFLASTTATNYTDSGLTNETTYYYQVSAVNAIDEGSLSNEASSTPSVSGGLVWGVSFNPSSSNFEEALAIATSSDAIYVVGYYDANPGSPGTDFGWRIEKRSMTDGALTWASTTNPAGGADIPYAIAADSSYIYVAGKQGEAGGASSDQWLIKKLSQSDGSLVWSQLLGNLTNTPPEEASAIAVDSNYVYIAGSDAVSGASNWRLERRDISDGSISTTSTLAGYWNFNEGNGTLANDQGIGTSYDNGILTNGPTWTNSSKIGGGLFFDGVDDYVNVTSASDINPSSAMTAAAWIKTTDNGANGNILSKTTGCASAGYIMWINENGVASQRPSFWVGNGPWLDAASGVNVTDGNWHHVVGTYDGSVSRIYVDGTESASSTVGAETLSSATNLQIGESTTCGDPLNGEIDEVRIYNRALSASEVSTLYNATTSPTTWAMSIDTYATSGVVTALALDSSHLYIAGYETVGASGNEQWRIEKRNIADGSIVWESTTNAGRSGATSSEIAYGIAKDDSYLYVIGYDDTQGSGNPQWKMEQRSKTGAIDDGLSSNRVAHWNFSEGSGTTAGDSSGSNNGTLTTATAGLPVWTFGQFSGALRFNGTSSYVNIPDSSTIWPTGSAFTLTTWAKVLGTGNLGQQQIIMSKNVTYLSVCYTGSNTPLYSFYDGTTQSLQTGGGPCPANGEWIHLAATWQSGVIARLYVNGNPAGFTSGVSVPYDTAAAGSLGRFDGGSYHFNGILDDMRVYNTALSQTQLLSMYHAGRGVASTTLSNPTSASDIPYGIVLDSDGIYVAGASNGFAEWRIEKRSNPDRTLVWATTSAISAGTDIARAITADASYLYIAGSDTSSGNEGWRIEKRRK